MGQGVLTRPWMHLGRSGGENGIPSCKDQINSKWKIQSLPPWKRQPPYKLLNCAPSCKSALRTLTSGSNANDLKGPEKSNNSHLRMLHGRLGLSDPQTEKQNEVQTFKTAMLSHAMFSFQLSHLKRFVLPSKPGTIMSSWYVGSKLWCSFCQTV